MTVKLGKVTPGRPNHSDDDDNAGLLPETYSDPDFRGASNVEFEGDRKPTFETGNGKHDLKHLPNLKPNERAGEMKFRIRLALGFLFE